MADSGSNGGGAGRSTQNANFAGTSFLYGGNATYVAQLQDAWEKNPASVAPEWREFFETLGDDKAAVEKNARGASWKRPNWPIAANGDMVSALDGDWSATEKILGDKIKTKAAAKGEALSAEDLHRATRDSVRAIMMIRAYRMRGHLHANLDPLGIEARMDHEELHPSTYGFEDGELPLGTRVPPVDALFRGQEDIRALEVALATAFTPRKGAPRAHFNAEGLALRNAANKCTPLEPKPGPTVICPRGAGLATLAYEETNSLPL